MKKTITILLVLAVLGLGYYFIRSWQANKLNNNPDFTSGNGRLEATEINIAARLAGKVEYVKVLEGDKVQAGDVLVVMQTNVLVANLAQAEAKKEQAVASEVSAKAKVAAQEATLERMKSELKRTQAEEKDAETKYNRYKKLLAQQATTEQLYETAETRWITAKTALLSAVASIKETEANLSVAKAEVIGAKANILAAEAEIASIKADIDDSVLRAPLKGRIQYRVAEPGEVLSAGGRALNMVDLTDVYMTFFLPEEIAGKVAVGTDVRIVLDAAPLYPLPAKISYVASVAQFTPKTVETKVERQKLMFRVKAHIDRELLEQYIDLVKTGLPGVAWVKLNPKAEWPAELQVSPEIQQRAEALRKQLAKKSAEKSAGALSETGMRKKSAVVDESALKKEAQGASKDGVTAVIVKAAKEIDAAKSAGVESAVQQAKSAAQQKKTLVEETVKSVKQADEQSRKATSK